MSLSGYSYQCSAGETFDSVSLSLYGDEKYACDLLEANPNLSRIVVFAGGEILRIPVVNKPAMNRANRYIPAVAPWK